jgi:hypothetical protein
MISFESNQLTKMNHARARSQPLIQNLSRYHGFRANAPRLRVNLTIAVALLISLNFHDSSYPERSSRHSGHSLGILCLLKALRAKAVRLLRLLPYCCSLQHLSAVLSSVRVAIATQIRVMCQAELPHNPSHPCSESDLLNLVDSPSPNSLDRNFSALTSASMQTGFPLCRRKETAAVPTNRHKFDRSTICPAHSRKEGARGTFPQFNPYKLPLAGSKPLIQCHSLASRADSDYIVGLVYKVEMHQRKGAKKAVLIYGTGIRNRRNSNWLNTIYFINPR